MTRRDERGAAVLFSLGVVVVLTTLGSSLLLRSMNEHQLGRRSVARQSAFFLAEAGVDQALSTLRGNWSWAGVSYTQWESTDSQRGGYAVDVDPPYEAGDVQLAGSTLRRITSSGYFPSNAAGTVPRRLEVIASSQSTVFDYGVFAAETVHLDSNAEVDSYDSRLGSWGGSNQGNDGDVGSNSTAAATITLDSNSKIKGDAVIGPNGNTSTGIVLNGNAQITGARGRLLQAKALGVDAYSSTGTGALVLDSNQSQTLPAGTYQYTHVALHSNASVLVSGNVTLYVDTYVRLDSNTQFTTTCGECTITIYVKGAPGDTTAPALRVGSNARLSASTPTKLTVYVGGSSLTTARSVSLDSNARLVGAVYAPQSAVTLDSNVVLYGAAIGKSVELDSNSRVHYDVALKSAGSGASAVRIRSWREL